MEKIETFEQLTKKIHKLTLPEFEKKMSKPKLKEALKAVKEYKDLQLRMTLKLEELQQALEIKLKQF